LPYQTYGSFNKIKTKYFVIVFLKDVISLFLDNRIVKFYNLGNLAKTFLFTMNCFSIHLTIFG